MDTRGKIGLVLFCFAICFCSVLLTRQYSTRDQLRPLNLYDVIDRQVQAVRSDNYSSAYAQVSGNFQSRINLDQFIGIVRSDYSHIPQSVRVEIGRIDTREDHAFVRVYFIDQKGQIVPCVYKLVSDGTGWKIDTARVLERLPEGSQLIGSQI